MRYEVQIVDDDPQELIDDSVEEIIVSKKVVAAIILAHKEKMKQSLAAIKSNHKY